MKYLLLPFVIVGRFLFWVLFIIAGWLLVRHLRRLQEQKKPDPVRPAGPAQSERMVACARCGLCLPESEGIRSGGEFYCCEEHRSGR